VREEGGKGRRRGRLKLEESVREEGGKEEERGVKGRGEDGGDRLSGRERGEGGVGGRGRGGGGGK
jgi:hypothetical protein